MRSHVYTLSNELYFCSRHYSNDFLTYILYAGMPLDGVCVPIQMLSHLITQVLAVSCSFEMHFLCFTQLLQSNRTCWCWANANYFVCNFCASARKERTKLGHFFAFILFFSSILFSFFLSISHFIIIFTQLIMQCAKSIFNHFLKIITQARTRTR